MFNFTPIAQSVLADISVTGVIAPEQLPIFVGSGPSHNVGAVPDPGAVAGNLRFLCEDGTFATPGGGGSVASVGLSLPGSVFSISGSPVIGSGTLTGSFVAQPANTVLIGPVTGFNNAPTFRALVAADIPALDTSVLATGVVSIARGGTGAATALAARTALGAASVGVNSDITSLTAATSLASPAALSLTAATGNVAISPSTTGFVTINAPSNAVGVLRIRNTSDQIGLSFYGQTTGSDLWLIGNQLSAPSITGPSPPSPPPPPRLFEIYDVVAGVSRLQISAGNTVLPNSNLQLTVANGANQTITLRAFDFLTSNTEVRLTYYDSGVSGSLPDVGALPFAGSGVLAFQNVVSGIVYTTTAVPLIFATSATERMRILGTGKIGINTTTPTEQLHVNGNVKAISFIGGAGGLTGITASQIPPLDASKITTGVLSPSQIPALDASKTTSGTLAASQIPSLDASVITTGFVAISRGGTAAGTAIAAINNLLPDQTGNSGRVLRTDGTNISWQIAAGTVTSVAAGNLSLTGGAGTLFTTGVSTNTTTPVVNFTLSAAAANSWFGNASSSSSAPTHNTTPIPSSLLPATVRDSVTALTMIPSTTVDWSLSPVFTGKTSNNVTFVFSNATPGQTIRIRIQSGGAFTVTWPAAVQWAGGTEPLMTQTSGRTDVYTILYDGSFYTGYYIQNCS